MIGEWCYFQRGFTSDECDKILELGLKLPAKDAELGVTGNFQDNQTRRSKIRFIEKHLHPEFDFVFKQLWNLAIQGNDDFFGFDISRLNYLQLAEYDAEYQGEYKPHVDVFWMNNDPKYHRKISCIVQLSDPSEYDGGDFEVYNTEQSLPKEPIRQKGSVIIIPSFVEHAALPVTRGKRYSLTAWFDGPKWR